MKKYLNVVSPIVVRGNMKTVKILALISLFAAGVLLGLIFDSASAQQNDDSRFDATGYGSQSGNTFLEVAALNPFSSVQPRDSPKDRIPEKAIAVYGDRVILDIRSAQWATFTDTHSMEPIITAGSNAIEIVPVSADDIKVGDIVSYKSDFADGYIIHRVVYKGEDEEGTYFIMKGDNLPTNDPGRIRFNQIQRVVVAIIY